VYSRMVGACGQCDVGMWTIKSYLPPLQQRVCMHFWPLPPPLWVLLTGTGAAPHVRRCPRHTPGIGRQAVGQAGLQQQTQVRSGQGGQTRQGVCDTSVSHLWLTSHQVPCDACGPIKALALHENLSRLAQQAAAVKHNSNYNPYLSHMLWFLLSALPSPPT
jgi:hypothetical protein